MGPAPRPRLQTPVLPANPCPHRHLSSVDTCHPHGHLPPLRTPPPPPAPHNGFPQWSSAWQGYHSTWPSGTARDPGNRRRRAADLLTMGLSSVPQLPQTARSALTPGQLPPAQGPTPLPEPVGSQPLPMCPLVWAQGHPPTCHREETRAPSVGCCDRAGSEGHEDRERQAGPEALETGQLAGSRGQIPGQEEDTGETLETGKIECELYSIDTIE